MCYCLTGKGNIMVIYSCLLFLFILMCSGSMGKEYDEILLCFLTELKHFSWKMSKNNVIHIKHNLD